MSLSNDLPKSWEPTTLDEVAHIEMGQSPESRYYNNEGIGLPFFQGKAEFGTRFPKVRKWCSEPTKIAETGDALLSIRAPVGPTNIAQVRSCIGRGLAAIRAEKGVNQLYLFYFLRHIESWLSEQGTGSTFAAISGQFVKQVEFALAPTEEQTRIVEKLEELFSDLDAGVAELKAAQKKLAQYRQSLLKAAVEGSLTAEWRTKNKPKETGAQLLERILKERRTRWEEKQLAKYKEQGKTPPKGWQDKYPEPVQPDTTNLPELPEGWVWASLDCMIMEGPQNGLYLPAEKYGHGNPILRIDDYQIGWVRSRSKLNLVDSDANTTALYSLSPKDIVVNRVNSMTHLGKSLVVPDGFDGVLFESNMMKFQLSLSVDTSYVGYYLGSDVGRKRLTINAKWAVNQASINQQDVKRAPVPLCLLDEQKTITSIVSAQLDAAKAQELAIQHSLTQAAAQRKNILKSAFSGQLVPQDPNDEPASVLLERIRAERQLNEKTGKSVSKTVKNQRKYVMHDTEAPNEAVTSY